MLILYTVCAFLASSRYCVVGMRCEAGGAPERTVLKVRRARSASPNEAARPTTQYHRSASAEEVIRSATRYHSYLRASIGFFFAARLAGKVPARKAIAIIIKTIIAMLTGLNFTRSNVGKSARNVWCAI